MRVVKSPITLDTPIGPDIDLDTEVVLLSDGTRLTEALAERMAEETMAEYYRARGRPSITGQAKHTPRLTFRVDPETRAALEKIATNEGRRLAEVSRDALKEYVARHPVRPTS